MLAVRAAYETDPTMNYAGAWTLLGIAALGIVLTTAYFSGLIRRLLQGEPAPAEPIRHLGSDDPLPGDRGSDRSGRIVAAQVTDRLTRVAADDEAEVDPDADLDREETVVTGVLVVSIVALGLIPGILSGPIGQAVPWIIGGVR